MEAAALLWVACCGSTSLSSQQHNSRGLHSQCWEWTGRAPIRSSSLVCNESWFCLPRPRSCGTMACQVDPWGTTRQASADLTKYCRQPHRLLLACNRRECGVGNEADFWVLCRQSRRQGNPSMTTHLLEDGTSHPPSTIHHPPPTIHHPFCGRVAMSKLPYTNVFSDKYLYLTVMDTKPCRISRQTQPPASHRDRRGRLSVIPCVRLLSGRGGAAPICHRLRLTDSQTRPRRLTIRILALAVRPLCGRLARTKLARMSRLQLAAEFGGC